MGNYKKKGKPQKTCECGAKYLGVGKRCYTCTDLYYSKRYNELNERISKKNTKNSL